MDEGAAGLGDWLPWLNPYSRRGPDDAPPDFATPNPPIGYGGQGSQIPLPMFPGSSSLGQQMSPDLYSSVLGQLLQNRDVVVNPSGGLPPLAQPLGTQQMNVFGQQGRSPYGGPTLMEQLNYMLRAPYRWLGIDRSFTPHPARSTDYQNT